MKREMTLATADHPGHGNSPTADKDDRQDACTCTVTGTDGVQYGDFVIRRIGAGVRVTLGGSTGGRSQWRLVHEGNQIGRQDTQHRHLLLQTFTPIPSSLLPPASTTICPIVTTRALLCSGLGRGFQLGEDQVGGARNDCSQHSKPVGKIGLEGDLVAIAVIAGFAGDIR